MNAKNKEPAAWRASIDARLSPLIAQWQRGIDIAPSQRHRFEGYLRAFMDMGVEAAQLAAVCQQLLPVNCTLEFDNDRGEFMLTLPQQRAPVFPSTND